MKKEKRTMRYSSVRFSSAPEQPALESGRGFGFWTAGVRGFMVREFNVFQIQRM